MHYIVFDLEYNQDYTSSSETDDLKPKCPFEIIQIGAVKLDSDFRTVSTFHQYVKPVIFKTVSKFVTVLTGITTEQLQNEPLFPEVYESLLEFIHDPESVFCCWGMSDVKELYRNINYYELDHSLLPKKYINIQPFASLHLGISAQKLLRLQTAVEALQIPITHGFHNAYHDAYYTAEILKIVYHSAILPTRYDPDYRKTSSAPIKKIIDFDGLIKQFEKMYNRNMSVEEIEIIKLAYQMGKTQQFLK